MFKWFYDIKFDEDYKRFMEARSYADYRRLKNSIYNTLDNLVRLSRFSECDLQIEKYMQLQRVTEYYMIDKVISEL